MQPVEVASAFAVDHAHLSVIETGAFRKEPHVRKWVRDLEEAVRRVCAVPGATHAFAMAELRNQPVAVELDLAGPAGRVQVERALLELIARFAAL